MLSYYNRAENTFDLQDTYGADAACAGDATCAAACDTTGLDVNIDTGNVSLIIWYFYVKTTGLSVNLSFSRHAIFCQIWQV